MSQTERTRFQRKPQRGSHDPKEIYPILDSHFLCHVGFVVDGEARVLPTAFVRIEDAVYLHGHLRNQMLRALLDGQTACITVTQLDGLVLARSGFHHSANYRCAVVFGKAVEVGPEEKDSVLNTLIDHMVPGRSATVRPASDQELNATLVIKIPIEEASAKFRSGPPIDLEADYELDIWAGVVKVKTVVAGIEACPRLKTNLRQPEHVLEFVNQHR
jgi:hypothetical protein